MVGGSIRIIPLGGVGEIGKNMLVVESSSDMVVIDAGLAFPDEEMLGIDIVIPDMTYIFERREKLRGLLLTHGHEDHIGALPYLLKVLDNLPVYGTRFTLGLAGAKLLEHGLERFNGIVIRPRSYARLGHMEAEFFRVNHSVPDSVGICLRTPAGLVVHSGDFKFDQTPVDREVTDFHTLSELGDEGVLVLLSDSTNADKAGYSESEREVGEAFDEIFGEAKGRIFVTSFSTNVHRIQQAINSARLHGRYVSVVGRSMEDVIRIATELGYLHIPEGLLIDVDELNSLPPEKVAILTTGSQGEPMSALSRMAMRDHRKIEIVPGDTVIIAASPVPGNEKLVHRTVNHLFKLGARVIYEPFTGVHVSGHASREELKLMINLVRPKYLVPIHGEYRHLVKHAELARSLGMGAENVLLGDNGTVFEFTPHDARIAGRVTAGGVLVDGLGVGDVGNVVLRDRRQLSKDGIVVVVIVIDEAGNILAGPDIVTRGFVYVKESEELLASAREEVIQSFDGMLSKGMLDLPAIKLALREKLGQFLFEQTGRRPMILPIVLQL